LKNWKQNKRKYNIMKNPKAKNVKHKKIKIK